jgi:protocatechuate 3,4-dioxygenase beta subunit
MEICMQTIRLMIGLSIAVLHLASCTTAPAASPILEPASATIAPTVAVVDQKATSTIPTQPVLLAVQPTTVQPTTPLIECTSPASLTPDATEGPYYTANAPERASLLEPGMPGTVLTLTGYVLSADCQPVSNALLDFWQADSQGVYDNASYTLRGRQYTDANGHYQLETVVPGLYPGRTEHIHVKVQAPGGPILTTQLFFPGVTDNTNDNIYNPALLIQIQKDNVSVEGTFNFIVATQ